MTLLTVVGTNKYDYVKPETGERKQGGSITYLSKSSSTGRAGYQTLEVAVPYSDMSVFDKVPAVYDIELDIVPVRSSSGGNSVRQVYSSASLVAPVDLDFPQKIKNQQQQK
jgi:hypothetical protein